MATSERTQVAGALVDLTRMLYFGPVVLSFFILGVMLAMPDAPLWGALARVLLAGGLGFAGGFVLNDWADWRADRTMLAARAHEAEYLAQLHRERRFTGTRPIAAGIVSPAAGLAFGLGLMAVSGAICLTFPSPNRWYLIAILAYSAVAEPAYCFIKQRQKLFPIATFFHAPMEALCPVAAYVAIRPPDLTPLGMFVAIYCWEVGFNQIYDTIDVENDRVRGITTLSSVLGVRFVAGWGFTFSTLCTAALVFTWWVAHAGPIMLIGVLGAGALVMGADAILFARPTQPVAHRTIGIHQMQLVLVVLAITVGAVLHWLHVL